MWRLPDDDSAPVISAEEQIHSAHRRCGLQLPGTAVVFFMSRGVEYLCAHYPAVRLPEPFPRFLGRCPIWEIGEYGICFLDGGRGAPQAGDTVETLAALGVKNIVAVGMCGAYDPVVRVGEVIAPDKAFVEEGTSLHYYSSIEYSAPDPELLMIARSQPQVAVHSIVSTDAVYRQTFEKERLWREKGAVGVDMETSAVFSVSRYLGLRAVGLLMVSDLHPMHPDAPKWEWKMTGEMREELTRKGIAAAVQLCRGSGS
jgi:purine-nucleoside phosphorylase